MDPSKVGSPQPEPPQPPSPEPSAPPAGPSGAAMSPNREVPLSYPAPNLSPNVNPVTTGPGPWSSGLCGCFSDMRSCCITFACPCITFGEISEIADKGSTNCMLNGILYGLFIALLGCACMYSCLYRTKLRKQYNIKGSTCEDCCIHTWCELCALCQEYRELQFHGFDMSIGWQGNVERQSPGVMTAPPTQAGMRR